MYNIEKIKIEKISDDKFFLNLIQNDEDMVKSQGMTFEKDKLYDLYIELKNIFLSEK